MIKNELLKFLKIIEIAIILCCLVGCDKSQVSTISTNGLNDDFGENIIENTVGIVGDKVPVSRALASKMVAFCFYNENQIQNMDKVIKFEDIDDSSWFEKYVNAVYYGDYMKGKEENYFMPEDNLTLQQAQYLMDNMIENNKTKIKLTDENKDKAISLALWNEIYKKAIQKIENNKIKEDTLIFIADNSTNNEIKDGFVITDKGLFSSKGIDTKNIIGEKVKVLIKENEIVTVDEIIDNEPEIKNILVTKLDERQVEFFIGGLKKRFVLNENCNNIQVGDICSIKIKNNNITDVSVSGDNIKSKIKRADNEKAEIEATGEIYFDEDFKVYYYDGEKAKLMQKSDLISGQSYNFFINENRLCAVIIDNQKEENNIRVLIKNVNGENTHNSINISCDEAFFIVTGKEDKEFKGGEQIEIAKGKNEDLFSRNNIVIKTKNENGYITIKNIDGSNQDFKAMGKVEVRKENDKFYIVNDVDIEKYLYGVMQGKEVEKYNNELGKAMAVISRSRAYKQRNENKIMELGANIDNSDSFQKYIGGESEIGKGFVDETKGEVIYYKDEIIGLNYFKEDCGVSANIGDVWADKMNGKFPTETPNYNSGKWLINKQDLDLSKEDDFLRFIKQDNKDNDWSRWEFQMTGKEVSACINTSIEFLCKDYPERVKVLDNNEFKIKSIKDIGDVKNIEVTKRGEFGNVMEMKIDGSKATVLLSTDNVIRKIIKPKQFIYGRNPIKVQNNGNGAENLGSMPSAFFSCEINKNENGEVSNIIFTGGGYGHGVGLSLSRAEKLSQNGKGYKEILKEFYNGTDIKK